MILTPAPKLLPPNTREFDEVRSGLPTANPTIALALPGAWNMTTATDGSGFLRLRGRRARPSLVAFREGSFPLIRAVSKDFLLHG